MTDIESRFLLDGAMDRFRVERARLDLGHEDIASELTARAAGFLSALASEARKALGIHDGAPSTVLRARLAKAPAAPATGTPDPARYPTTPQQGGS